MFLFLLVLAALAAGVYVAARQPLRKGCLRAVLAGTGTLVGVVLLGLVTLVSIRPLAILTTTGCLMGALHSYDRGQLWRATGWVAAAGVFMWCAGWPS